MRIVLTNDDGIHAPGLAALYRAIAGLGEVHVVAPADVQSATSHAATFHKPMLTWREAVTCAVTESTFEGFAVQGRPADCVKLALSHLVPGPVDLVISGMNSGANIGINTIYSGTVAAAREAAFIGTPAIAVSLHIGDPRKTRWDAAARQARQVIDHIVEKPLAPHTLLNLNIPKTDDAVPPRGVRIVPISTSPLSEKYDIHDDAEGRTHYRSQDDFTFRETPPDTDVHALFEHFITLTPMHFDLTHHGQLLKWSGMFETDSVKR